MRVSNASFSSTEFAAGEGDDSMMREKEGRKKKGEI